MNGYRAAMNSPEVRALYEALNEAASVEHGNDGNRCWCTMELPERGHQYRCRQAREALAAYEKGLKDA